MTTRLSQLFLLFLLCFMTAAASFQGYYNKWGLREDSANLSLKAMLDGTAERPWAYRQLVPWTATKIEAAMPQGLRDKLATKFAESAQTLHFVKENFSPPVTARDRNYAVRYYLVYYMAFASLLASMGLMILAGRQIGISLPGALIGAMGFTLFLPVLLTVGGYYYDLAEIMFMFLYLALLFCPKLRWLCVPVAALATLNKESFLFFVATTGPLVLTYGDGLKGLFKDRTGIAIVIVSALASGLTHAATLPYFANSPGEETQFWLIDNIKFYANPKSLFQTEGTYGLPLLAGYNPVTIALLAIVFWVGTRRLGPRIRFYLALAALINVPLWLAFAYPGELRNLSFLFPPLMLCLGATADAYLSLNRGPAEPRLL